jgi:hypothetical protein
MNGKMEPAIKSSGILGMDEDNDAWAARDEVGAEPSSRSGAAQACRVRAVDEDSPSIERLLIAILCVSQPTSA